MVTKTFIKVHCQFEGFHRYKNAPNAVAYLRNLHRHLFGVMVQIEVFNNDREIEFYVFKNWLQRMINTMKKKDTDSCEIICDRIYQIIISKYPNRKMIIECNEDYLEGAVKYYGLTI